MTLAVPFGVYQPPLLFEDSSCRLGLGVESGEALFPSHFLIGQAKFGLSPEVIEVGVFEPPLGGKEGSLIGYILLYSHKSQETRVKRGFLRRQGLKPLQVALVGRWDTSEVEVWGGIQRGGPYWKGAR